MVTAVIVAPIVTAVIVAPLALVIRGVCSFIPIVVDEVHGLAAGVVASAISPPVLLLMRPNAEIERRRCDRPRLNYDRLRIEKDGLRRVADADCPEEPRIADGHGDSR